MIPFVLPEAIFWALSASQLTYACFLVHIVALVAELLAFPLVVALANVLPISRFNPDHHFNIKEHALITIMSNVSFGWLPELAEEIS